MHAPRARDVPQHRCMPERNGREWYSLTCLGPRLSCGHVSSHQAVPFESPDRETMHILQRTGRPGLALRPNSKIRARTKASNVLVLVFSVSVARPSETQHQRHPPHTSTSIAISSLPPCTFLSADARGRGVGIVRGAEGGVHGKGDRKSRGMSTSRLEPAAGDELVCGTHRRARERA